MKVLFVESPGKVQKIHETLGRGFLVVPTIGHFRDLSPHDLDVDLNTLEETYHGNKDIVDNIVTQAGKASKIYLATDPDREGEAIAWHLEETFREVGVSKPLHRITFQAITEDAIQRALNKTRKIDIPMVDAARSRPVLDRLVGYQVSPILWFAGIPSASTLSAGRVQISALNIVMERDQRIRTSSKQCYFVVSAILTDPGSQVTFVVKLDVDSNIEESSVAQPIVGQLKDPCTTWKIASKVESTIRSTPLPPFTTATMLESANNKLRFGSKKTISIAQKLYETGLITYMRSDSVWADIETVQETRDAIAKKFGAEYVPQNLCMHKNKDGNAQEGHEAVRPAHTIKPPLL